MSKNENMKIGTIEAIVVAIATLGGWIAFGKADEAHKALRGAGYTVSRALVREAWKARTTTAAVVETVVLADKTKSGTTTKQPPRTIEGGKTRKSGRTTIGDEDLIALLQDLRNDGTSGVTSAMKAIKHLRSNGMAASQARVHAAWKQTVAPVVDEEE